MRHDLLRFGLPITNAFGLFAVQAQVSRAAFRFALTVMRLLGFFRIARHITRGGLRIICYHGFALAEEYKYRSKLFIRDDFFRRRIEYLRRERYPILALSDAIDALSTGRLPPCATVITMDDGWHGVYSIALPIIKELQIPVTVYVATYYVENPMPVYTVTVSYLFWQTKVRRVTLPRGLGAFELDRDKERAQAERLAQEFGASSLPADRLAFLKQLAEALDVSFDDIERNRLFRVMNEPELRCLAEAGIDIQLHSHRHQWPLHDREMVESEIVENRRFLERITSKPLEHFCYPSGVYGLHQAEWLAGLGVKSATTLEPGLNYPDTPLCALRRMLDGGPVSDIEFAAEMTGLMEIVRWIRQGQLISMIKRQLVAGRLPAREARQPGNQNCR